MAQACVESPIISHGADLLILGELAEQTWKHGGVAIVAGGVNSTAGYRRSPGS